MANLKTVGVTAGVPDTGTGNVSTIDVLATLISSVVSTLTRPANTTAYTAGDSISNNATAGSVTALSASVSDTNDDPILVESMLLHSTDNGLRGKNIRAYIYNSDPTANSGVGAGDNAAFSNKKAGFLGTMTGYLHSFSDGAAGQLFPEGGQAIIAPPTTGAKTLYVQYQALEDFTPSANSTTLIGTICARQGRIAS